MAGKPGKRIFGELEKRKNSRTGNVTGWRARHVGPDTERHHQTFGDKMAAEAVTKWARMWPLRLCGR